MKEQAAKRRKVRDDRLEEYKKLQEEEKNVKDSIVKSNSDIVESIKILSAQNAELLDMVKGNYEKKNREEERREELHNLQLMKMKLQIASTEGFLAGNTNVLISFKNKFPVHFYNSLCSV